MFTRLRPSRINVDALRPAEHENAAAIQSALNSIPTHVEDFVAAFRLFEFILNNLDAIDDAPIKAARTASAWAQIAARDGALSIFHFGKLMEGIKQTLHSVPVLDSSMDRAKLRAAANLFRQHFRG